MTDEGTETPDSAMSNPSGECLLGGEWEHQAWAQCVWAGIHETHTHPWQTSRTPPASSSAKWERFWLATRNQAGRLAMGAGWKTGAPDLNRERSNPTGSHLSPPPKMYENPNLSENFI